MNEARLRSIVTPHNFVLPNNPLRFETTKCSKQRIEQASIRTLFPKCVHKLGSPRFVLEAVFLINGYCRSCFESSSGSCSFFKNVSFLSSNSWNVRGWTVPSKVQPVVEDRRSKNHVQSMSWKACNPDKLENPVVWANNASPMILNVLCRISLCGVLKIFHPCLCAMSKSPRLNGSAMLALLGTLSSIWWSWYLLCHVQWAPMMLLSGWC